MKKVLLPLLTLWVSLLQDTNANAEPESRFADTKPLDYVLVITGGELLEGAYPDAHTHFVTRTLRPLGCRCVGSIIVDDEREAMQHAVQTATNRVSLVIVTGGLGPTPNDITRETLSELTGIPLREHPDVLVEFERRFNQPRAQLRANLRRQTLVPTRGGYLKNANGTAVGLIFELGKSSIVALPGPPKELQPMVKNELAPYLQRRFGVRSFGSSLTLRFVGVGQSLIDQTIKDHLAIAPDTTITSLFESSRVDFTFSVPGRTRGDWDRLKRLEEEIRQHLGEYLYADDGSSLEQVIVKALLERGGSLALVEVGSGGHLAAALSGTDGISRLLAGAYAAPTEPAMRQLLRMPVEELQQPASERVKTMAAAAARLNRSQWAIAVGPSELGPTGGNAVWVAFKFPGERLETVQITVREAGEIHRSHMITQILDQLRRRFKQPQP
ncbi:MAG: CinA family protein [Verrucomicrobia bacterium]|nr:CinA family protein [Verrucomicrobiota bacterium]